MPTRAGLAQGELAHGAGGGVVEADHARHPACAATPGHGAHPTRRPRGRAGTVVGHATGPREAHPRRHRGRAGRALGDGGHLPLRPDPHPRRGVRHRHPAAHGERVAPRGPRVLLHPHRHHRPLPAHAGPGRLLPHGLGRQRPAHRAPGAELLRRPLRPVAPLRPRPSRRRPRPPSRPMPGVAAQLHRAVRAAHRRGRAGLRGPVPPAGALGRLVAGLRHHRRPVPPGQPAGLPAQPGPGRGLPGRGAHAVGRRLPTAVAQAEMEDRELPGRVPHARVPPGRRRRRRPHRHHPPRAAGRLRVPRRPPRRRPLPRPLRHRGDHAAVRRPGPGEGPPAGRPREGHRHRHGVHLRRHHRRHLVARARAAVARHRRLGRPAAALAAGGAQRRGRGPLRRRWPARR